MNAKKEIESIISRISGKYSPYQVFSDWIQCCAISISNAMVMIEDKTYRDREKEYVAIINKYSDDEKAEFAKMFVSIYR